MSGIRIISISAALLAALALAGCEEGAGSPFAKKPTGEGAASKPRAVKTVEQDVERPEVFSANEEGLWDGRPSLGGIWIAHPNAKDPERVVIRNEANNKFVIGALFKRERENPGPKLQLSSEAAASIGVVAGQPTKLSVVALRRETVEIEDPAAAEMAAEGLATEEIESKTLDPIAGAAAAAIESSEAGGAAAKPTDKPKAKADKPKTKAVAAAVPSPAKPAAATAAAPQSAGELKQSYIQIGFYGDEANAKATADKLRKDGVMTTVKPQTAKGKNFWRVIVGPANSGAERAELLKKIKGLGYADAYFVSG